MNENMRGTSWNIGFRCKWTLETDYRIYACPQVCSVFDPEHMHLYEEHEFSTHVIDPFSAATVWGSENSHLFSVLYPFPGKSALSKSH